MIATLLASYELILYTGKVDAFFWWIKLIANDFRFYIAITVH